MSHTILPHLQCLRATVGSLSTALSTDPALSAQCAISERLLDRMIFEATALPQFRNEFRSAVQELLPSIETAFNGSHTSADAIMAAIALKSADAESDSETFELFSSLVGAVQRGLLALNRADAAALAKALVMLESTHTSRCADAVAAQSAKSAADGQTASTVSNAKTYDEAALQSFIRHSFPEEPEVSIHESGFVSGGYSKFTISISLANARILPEKIILRGDASSLFGGVSVIDEYRLIKTLHEHGVRVPKPLALEDSGTVFGSPFLLVEKLPGTIIGHMFNPPPPNKAVCEDVAAQLATIHRVPVAALGKRIDGAGTRSSEKALCWINEAVANWTPLKQPSPIFETAFDWLRRHAPLNDRAPRTLVHADYGLNNLLIDKDRVSAILDWEFAHVGNPAYDLGYFYFQAQRLSSWDDFLRAYAQAGMPVPEPDQLDYNILLAATRLGVMLCQAQAPFLSGAAPGLAGAAMIGNCFYEDIVIRNLTHALNRVL